MGDYKDEFVDIADTAEETEPKRTVGIQDGGLEKDNDDDKKCGTCGYGFYSDYCKCINCDKCGSCYHVACEG